MAGLHRIVVGLDFGTLLLHHEIQVGADTNLPRNHIFRPRLGINQPPGPNQPDRKLAERRNPNSPQRSNRGRLPPGQYNRFLMGLRHPENRPEIEMV